MTMRVLYAGLSLLAFLMANVILLANARARVVKSGLPDKVVNLIMILRVPGLGASVGAILAAAMGQIGWMAVWLLGAAACFGGAELVWRQQRAMARQK
jgi:hypothetical protein